jgi:hypothetical protein
LVLTVVTSVACVSNKISVSYRQIAIPGGVYCD